jgi:hypothetical protein
LKINNSKIKYHHGIISGNNIYIENSGTLDFAWKIRGGHMQATRDGRQLFNNTLKGYGHYGAVAKTILTGVRLSVGTDATVSDHIFGLYATINLSNFVGKTVRMKAMFKSNSNLKGRYSIGLCDSNGTNRLAKDSTNISEKEISFVIPSLETGQEFLGVWFYANSEGTGVAGDYVDYTDVIITIDNENMTYEPYTGGIPSPNPDYPSEIETVGSNANLFDGELEFGSLANNTGQNYANAKNTRSKNYIAVEENATYVLSDNIKGSFIVHAYDENKNWLSMIGAQNYTGQYIFVTPPQTSYIRFRTNETDLNAKIKLEKGSIATPYSPPGMGSVEINTITKNFINMQKKTTNWNGASVTVENNKITFSGASDGSLGLNFSSYESKIRISKGNKVAYSSRYVLGSYTVGNTYYNLKLIYQDGTFTTINMNRSISTYKNDISNTITLKKDVVAYQINGAGYAMSGLTNELVYEFQLEIGDTASNIVEQSSQTAIMPIQQEMLDGDYTADVEHHEWGKAILSGNEDVIIDGTYSGITQFKIAILNVKKQSNPSEICVLSNYFLGVEWNNSWTKNNSIVNRSDNSVRVMTSKYTTIDGFKALLKSKYDEGNPVVIYYKLEKTINLELTEEQKTVRDTKLYTYKNITNINVSDELASVEVEYKKDQDTINKNYENRLAALEAASIS